MTYLMIIAVVLAVVAGITAAMQTAMVGRLGQKIGAAPAMTFTNVGSAVTALVLLLVQGQRPVAVAAGLSTPWWMWTAGFMGALYLVLVALAAPRIGTTSTVVFVIAGQLTIGVIIDQFGLFLLNPMELSWHRVAGVMLLAAGSLMSLHRSKKEAGLLATSDDRTLVGQ